MRKAKELLGNTRVGVKGKSQFALLDYVVAKCGVSADVANCPPVNEAEFRSS
jgi:hypothetical protein